MQRGINMKSFKLKIVACLLFAGASAWGNLSHARTTDGLEAKVAGAWQKGLAKKVKSMSPWQQQMYVGSVLVLNADHHFLMYPKCGPEAAAYKAKKILAMTGEWRIAGDGALHLAMTHDGKSFDQGVPVIVEGDEMIWGKGTSRSELFGRYDGPLPPQCPHQ
jgi:hypothetical protein